jgi:hypothetical protein
VVELALNDSVTRELKSAAQVDTFRLTTRTPLRLFVGVSGTTGNPAVNGPRFSLRDSATGTVVATGSATTAPYSRPPLLESGWTQLAQPGTYLLLVSGDGGAGGAYLGTYLLRLGGSDPRPEVAKAALAAGDSVVDGIDGPYDVDEYLLTLGGGSPDLALTLHAETGQAADTLYIEGRRGGRLTESPFLFSLGTDPHPLVTVRGAFNQQFDTLRVRVGARGASTRSRYRLAFYRVDRGPERAAPRIVPGDTLTEALDYPRDVDEFTFVGDPGREYAVAFQGASGSKGDSLRLDVVGAMIQTTQTRVELKSAGDAPRLLSTITDRFRGGTYTVRVSSDYDEVRRGAYRFVVVPIDPRPETAPSTLALGDTIAERIELEPDVDEYDVPVRQGESVVLYAQALGNDTLAGVRLDAAVPASSPASAGGETWLVRSGTSSLRAWRSPLLTAGAAGTLRVRVTATNRFSAGYRLAAVRINAAPETANPRLTIDVPTGEVLDPPGDVDDYAFEGVAGQEITAYLAGPQGPGAYSHAVLELTHLASGLVTYVTGSVAAGLYQRTGIGLQKLLWTGTYRVRVLGQGQTTTAVPYQLVIHGVKRLPERAAAVARIGDTIDESIFPGVDIDEFQLVAPAGTRYQVCVQSLGAPTSNLGGIFLTVFPSPAPYVYGSAGIPVPTPPQEECTGTLNGSAAGNALVRVHPVTDIVDLPYRIQIRAVP